MDFEKLSRRTSYLLGAVLLLNGVVVVGLLPEPGEGGLSAVYRGLVGWELAYVAGLALALAAAWRRQPRPWLTFGAVALVAADAVIFTPVYRTLFERLAPLVALALLWKLLVLAVLVALGMAQLQAARARGVSAGSPWWMSAAVAVAVASLVRHWHDGRRLDDLRQVSSRMATCQADLRAWYAAERAFFRNRARYTEQLAELGFAPAPGNRYAYFGSAAPAGTVQVDLKRFPHLSPVEPGQLPPLLNHGAPGLVGTCPSCQAVMACAGQLDEDPTLDVWSVSTTDRALSDGGYVPAGEPLHEVDDPSVGPG